MKDGFGTTFGFSLCTAPQLVTQIAYFRRELEKLRGLKILEGGKICHCQY